jgi:hypothetical protein
MEELKQGKYHDIGKPWNAERIQNFILIGISLLFIVALGIKLFVNISRVDFIADPPSLFPDGRSTVTIKAIPYNAVGFRVPFKSVRVFYEIEIGREKVDIISRDINSITLRAKHATGDIILRARIGGDTIPYEIVVPIMPQFAYY